MKKIKKLNNCKELLQQSLNVIYNSEFESQEIFDAKNQIKKAIENIDNFINYKESINKNNSNLYKDWWSNIESGLNNASKINDEEKIKHLDKIEELIKYEKEKIKK
jgi:hypothetical protein